MVSAAVVRLVSTERLVFFHSYPFLYFTRLDVHMELESRLAKFIGTEAAIIYAQGFSAISSIIPAFAKRGDIIVCDENINFAAQRGAQLSRSVVKYYKHNDMTDLERILRQIRAQDVKTGRLLTRRFIIAEGLSNNDGDIAPLPELVIFLSYLFFSKRNGSRLN